MNDGEWSKTLAERLFEQRVVGLHGALDDTVATRVSAELMTLDAEGDGPVTLRIDSAGGSVALALTVMDVIELLGVPVRAAVPGPGRWSSRRRAVGVHTSVLYAQYPLLVARADDAGRGAGARGGAVGAAAGRRAAPVHRARGSWRPGSRRKWWPSWSRPVPS